MAAPAGSPQKLLHGVHGAFATTPYPSGTETFFNFRNADLTVMAGADDVTNSGDDGWGRDLRGIKRVTGSFTFTIDLANKPYINPHDFTPGNEIYLKFILNAKALNGLLSADADSSQTYSGLAMIGDWGPKTGPQAGPVEVTVPFKSQGAWVIPTT